MKFGFKDLKIFVLITLASFVVIFLILISISGTTYSNTKVGAVDSDFKSLLSNLDMYKINGKIYPTQEQGLMALLIRPTSEPIPLKWTATLQSPEDFLDPWGTSYQYKYPGTFESSEPEIISAGPDGQFNTEDDLSSQE